MCVLAVLGSQGNVVKCTGAIFFCMVVKKGCSATAIGNLRGPGCSKGG